MSGMETFMKTYNVHTTYDVDSSCKCANKYDVCTQLKSESFQLFLPLAFGTMEPESIQDHGYFWHFLRTIVFFRFLHRFQLTAQVSYLVFFLPLDCTIEPKSI